MTRTAPAPSASIVSAGGLRPTRLKTAIEERQKQATLKAKQGESLNGCMKTLLTQRATLADLP